VCQLKLNPSGSVRPILWKNSFSTIDEKILAVIGSEARFRLWGYMKELLSRCGTCRAGYEVQPGQIFDCLNIRPKFVALAISGFSTE
jgi:hypothetical protein